MSVRWGRNSLLSSFLLASTAIVPAGYARAQSQAASAQSAVTFNIPAQPLSSALTAFARQSGIKLAYPASLSTGKSAPALRGSFASADALGRLLAGSGLSFQFTSANAVTILDPSIPAGTNQARVNDGSLVLDTINVTSAGGAAAADRPYQTPGSSAHISAEQISRFPASSPGDILKNAPGVLSGENRNGGAIDVNIRGMQGMGRVPVAIDGSINATTVYQGYQGVGNRSYIDPDLIGGVSIEKGPSTTPGSGIGGLVSMRTINADDILRPGQTIGLRVKGGLGTNTTDAPPYLTRGGYNFPSGHSRPGVDTRPDGLDRPGLFAPTSKNGSIAAAAKTEDFELVAAIAGRSAGNYFAGKNGPVAGTTGNVGPVRVCNAISCSMQNPYYTNSGLTVFRAGEEVLNTSSDTASFLLKGKALFDGGHALELGYIGFRSKNGDVRASGLTDAVIAPAQQYLSTANTDTFTARYHWKPADSDLIDLKANAWTGSLAVRQQTLATTSSLAMVGRPALAVAPTYVGSNSRTSGGDVMNTSRFELPVGRASLSYGGSYLFEETAPTDLTKKLETFKPRDGERQEGSVFSKVSWLPVEWLTLDGGLRYQAFRSKDRADQLTVAGWPASPQGRSGGGFAPGVGVTIEPVKGIQIFGKYTEGLRLPSLMETSGAFLLLVSADIKPERAHTWEFGGNVLRDGVFDAKDRVRLKVAYFDNTVDDYLSRQYLPLGGGVGLLNIQNIAQARFAGLEMQGEYQINGFSIGLMGTYYTRVEFCRTLSTCSEDTLASDYANNYVPPQYTASLTMSQKFFDGALTVGGKVSHVGPRPGGAEPTAYGAQALIAPIYWKPYTLVDLFASYKVNDAATLDLNVENLTDRYYVDPLSLALMPSPGRTLRASMTVKF
jgi:hemoglobin/transferrin/lactoferrin receptor protein